MSAAAAADGCPEAYLELALRLADAARPILMGHFRSRLVIDTKDDASPVTAADREAEAAMRAIIGKAYPEHGILGEEEGRRHTETEYVWVLDPIDGTQTFVTGNPLFGTLIALTRDGAPILGVIDCPALGDRWLGASGRATQFNGDRARTRPCAALEGAWLDATSPHMFPPADFEAFERLRGRVRRTVYGGECCAYGFLASGHLDLVVEATMKPYDYCALVPVVEGAGGVMSDWRGKPLGLQSDGRVIAAGDAGMHRAALEVLAAGKG